MTGTHNVEICRGGNPIIVHVSALKPYYVPTVDGSRGFANEDEWSRYSGGGDPWQDSGEQPESEIDLTE